MPVRQAPGSQRPSQSGCGAGRAQHHHAGGEEEGAGDDHGAVAEAVGELAGRAGDDRRERRAGQGRGAGLQHRVAPDRGEEEDVAEDQREEGGGEEQGAEVADAEGAVGEQRRLDDRARVAAAAARRRRRAAARRRRSSRGSALAVQPQSLPSTIASVTSARLERQHQRAGQVRQAAVAARALDAGRRPAQTHGGAERQVDEEDEAPVGELDQRAAEGRADRRRRGRGGAPDADAGGAPLGREGVEDDRQRGRRDHRRADPLEDAEGDQQRRARARRAQSRLAAVKPAMPSRKMRLWPKRSARPPAGTSSAAMTTK